MVAKPLEYPRGNVKMDGLIARRDYSNQKKGHFTKTAAEILVGVLPANSILEQVMIKNSEAFEGSGSIALGDGATSDFFIKDDDFPKTLGLQNPMMIGAPITEETEVYLTVTGTYTAGAGIIWLIWRPLL